MKFSTIWLAAILALAQTSTQFPLVDTRAVKPNLVSVIVTETLVTYKIHINKNYKNNGVYSWDDNWSLTVTNAPTKINLRTYATSTDFSTSKSYGTYSNGKGKTQTVTTTVTVGGPTSSLEVTDSSTLSSSISTTTSHTTSTSSIASSTAAKTSTAALSTSTPNCGIKADGPTELGWQTTAGNFAASSWEDCFLTCIKDIQYCVSFAFAGNGIMPSGQECIIMRATTSAPGIWNGIGDSAGNFVLYDETCPVPAAAVPVKKSSADCGITFNNVGGATVEALETQLIANFTTASLADCKAICDRLDGYCGSYTFNTLSKSRNCQVLKVAIEDPGMYEFMGQPGTWISYDAGCAL